MTGMLTGCARRPTDTRDLDSSRRIPLGFGVPGEQIPHTTVEAGELCEACRQTVHRVGARATVGAP